MEIRKAERKKAKLRLGIAAPSGAGKTYSALLLAFGLGGKIGLIDTEHGSGDLYAHLGDYDIIGIEAPYTVSKYLQAIKAFEQAGYSTIIIDSLSHAWAGDGGLLDKQGKIADSGKANGFAAWRTITPEHNALVEAMLRSSCHIIATMRAKQEYVLEMNDKGKQTPKKVGLAPVQREGMEYEFTVMLDVDMNHVASASKDRTGLFDGQHFKITEDTGKTLLGWLDAGTAPEVFDDGVFEGNQIGMMGAETMEELKELFSMAYTYAKRHKNAEAMAAAKTVYEGRKAELEAPQEEVSFGEQA